MKTALEQEKNFGPQARAFVAEDFYVDDGLTSCPTVDEATDLILNTRAMLSTANLRVHKIASNSLALMSKISPEDRADNFKNLNLQKDLVPVQQALGVCWNLLEDCFTFVINTPKKPFPDVEFSPLSTPSTTPSDSLFQLRFGEGCFYGI